jgi:hypothetical protein
MKFYRRFRIVRAGFPSGLFEEIQQHYPTGVRNDEFVLECQPDDGPTCAATIEKLLALCDRYKHHICSAQPPYGFRTTVVRLLGTG